MSEEIDKSAIIREFTEVAGEHFVKLFKLLQLETHIEVMLKNDPTNEEWILSLKKIPHYLKDLDRDKKIKSQSDELRQLREELDKVKTTHYQELSDQLVQDNERLTAEVEKLKADLKQAEDILEPQIKGALAWQNEAEQLEEKVEKLKGLLERCSKFILNDVQNLADYMPQSMISEAVSITKTIEEIESTLNPGER